MNELVELVEKYIGHVDTLIGAMSDLTKVGIRFEKRLAKLEKEVERLKSQKGKS